MIFREEWYRNIWFRIPFTLYFIAREKNGFLCLARREFDGEGYYWRRI